MLENEVYALYDDLAYGEMETEDQQRDWKSSVSKIDLKVRKKAEMERVAYTVEAKDESVEQEYKQLPFIR